MNKSGAAVGPVPARRPGRKADDHERRRAEIYRIAAAVFGQSGFEGGTTTEIARRAGLSQPALYHYVGSKEKLLDGICVAFGSRLYEELSAARSEGGTAKEQLAAFISGHLRVMLSELDSFRVYMAESRNLPARTRTRIKQEERRYLEEVVDLVRAAQREGSVHRDVDPWVLTQLLFGMMGSLVRWYRPSGKVGPAEIHASIERLVFVKA